MPIRPENKHRYPANWLEIRERILARAGYCCEKCGAIDHAIGYRENDGMFVMTDINARLTKYRCVIPHEVFFHMPDDAKRIEIVLTIAHLDHTPENCHDDNLRAWCQRCHLMYDADHHAQTAYATRRVGRAAGDLFGEVSQCA